ncbi:hypothetical protein ACFVYG_19370 [Streptomyces sp. NPDC058256]|uniref:hypothetical protein n=1 Tax=Streptomyces sp. NPDC058256 TaxID=3346408 RepID=UPI0036F16DC8
MRRGVTHTLLSVGSTPLAAPPRGHQPGARPQGLRDRGPRGLPGKTVKAYEIDKGTLLAVSGEELREIPLSTAKAIETAAFVPVASIDQLQVGDGYCLQADSQVDARPYKLRSKAVFLSIMDAVLIEHRV